MTIIKQHQIIKIILLLVSVIIPILSHAQAINYTDGNCVSGICQNGKGVYLFNNGDKYIGNFTNGKINGRGKYEYTNPKAYYDGLWKNGQREDNNAIYENESYKYIGGYKNNKQNGLATITFFKGNRAGDTFVGEIVDNKFLKGTYTYGNQHPNRKQYEGEFTNNNNKFHGKGTLTYKNGDIDEGFWENDVFLGTKIGVYHGQDVIKKGDTIITTVNGYKYLLSKQSQFAGNKDENYGFLYPYGKFYLIHTTIDESEKSLSLTGLQTGQTRTVVDAIGYIPFQESHKNYQFYEINGDKEKAVYEKFKQFCEWQICKMENSANNSLILSNDIKDIQNEYAELYAIIARQKAFDVGVNILGDISDLLWKNKIIKELEKNEFATIVFLGENISMSTSLKDYIGLLTTDVLTLPLSSSKQTLGGFTFKDIKDCIQNFVGSLEGVEDLTFKDIIKDKYRTEKTKQIEKQLEAKVANYLKKGINTIDCLPPDVKFKSGQIYLYYAVTKNIVELGEMSGYLAASIKLTFFDSREKEYDMFVTNCRKKKEFLEKYSNEYKTLIEKNQHNCLEIIKAINKLKSGVDIPFGDKNTQEVLTLMKDYVFGTKEIPKCNILNATELKPVEKQLQITSSEPQKTQIGTYKKSNNEIPVFYQNNTVFIEDIEYLLFFQPLQKSFDKALTRYFLIYEGKGKNKNELIGWVDHDNKNKYEFFQYYDKIPGLNYFGSIYIGDNNPENPNGGSNFDLPAQDKIDEAAKQHDICYDNNGLKGAKGVFLSSEGLHCEQNLTAACLKELNLTTVESFSVNNYTINTEYQSFLSNAFDASIGRLPRIFYMERNTGDRAVLVMGLFSVISGKKAYEKTLENTFDKILINNNTYKITFSKTTTLISATNEREQFNAQPGDTFEGEMKDGKIVQGKVVRNGETVKTFWNRRGRQ